MTDRIRIGDSIWMIRYVGNLDVHLFRSDGSLTIGSTDGHRKIIYISDLLRGKRLKRVMTHEICHAFCFEFGYELDMMEEERLCDFVSLYCDDIVSSVYNALQTKSDHFGCRIQ